MGPTPTAHPPDGMVMGAYDRWFWLGGSGFAQGGSNMGRGTSTGPTASRAGSQGATPDEGAAMV